MKLTDIAIAHSIPVQDLNEYVKKHAKFPIKENLWGDIIIPDDVDIECLIQSFLRGEELLAQEYLDEKEQIRLKEEELVRKQKEEQYHLRIDTLKAKNVDGYYEYKVVSLLDVGGLFNSNSGRVNTEAMTQTLNELGIDGWRLVTAYSNELGKNALSGGAGGILLGVNSTVDENILVFERFVKI